MRWLTSICGSYRMESGRILLFIWRQQTGQGIYVRQADAILG